MKINSLKIVSAIVILAMLFAGMFGCAPAAQTAAPGTSAAVSTASQAATEGPAPTQLPKLSFSVLTVNFGTEPTGKPVEEAWMKKCSELMGRELDIKFQYELENDLKDKLPVVLASGELPDLITLDNISPSVQQSDIIKYGDSGLFVDLMPYMSNGRMPEYKKLWDYAPSSTSQLLSSDGKLYGFYFMTVNVLAADGGHDFNYASGIRKDILDKNNIAIPTTIDELTAAAEQLKKVYPNKYPISPNSAWESPFNLLVSTNHCGDLDKYTFYDGAKWQYAPLTEGFKDAVTTMNLWVKEKLVAPDYMSFTDAQGQSALTAGDAMILPFMWYGLPAYWAASYPDQKWVMVAGISNPKYGKPWVYSTYSRDDTSIQSNYSIAISARSKYIEEMAQFLNIQCSPDIIALENWGFEGQQYTVTDGAKKFIPAFLDSVMKDSTGNVVASLPIGTGSSRPGIFPQVQDNLANAQTVPPQDMIINGKMIRGNYQDAKRDTFEADEMTPVSGIKQSPMSADESNNFANIMTPIDTYAKAQVALFILGKRPLSEWDVFVSEVKKMGDIQKALDIYNTHTSPIK